MPDDLLRLGDIRGLTIEITPAALANFRRGLTRARDLRQVTDDAVRAELLEQLRATRVTWLDWDPNRTVRVRRRDKPGALDVEAQLLLVSTTYVRCTHAQARHLRRSDGGDAAYHTRDIYSRDGRLGILRVPREGARRLEFRPMAIDDATSPPWGPVPEHVRAALRQVERNAGATVWLARLGVSADADDNAARSGTERRLEPSTEPAPKGAERDRRGDRSEGAVVSTEPSSSRRTEALRRSAEPIENVAPSTPRAQEENRSPEQGDVVPSHVPRRDTMIRVPRSRDVDRRIIAVLDSWRDRHGLTTAEHRLLVAATVHVTADREELARLLQIEPDTLKSHATAICRRLGTPNVARASLLAVLEALHATATAGR